MFSLALSAVNSMVHSGGSQSPSSTDPPRGVWTRLFLDDDNAYWSNVYLTNRFHVAVRLFSNRSQMTSKCGKNKKVAHEAIAECVTDVLTTF